MVFSEIFGKHTLNRVIQYGSTFTNKDYNGKQIQNCCTVVAKLEICELIRITMGSILVTN